jgi:hypothetical protein
MKSNLEILRNEFPGMEKWAIFSNLAREVDISEIKTEFPNIENSILKVLHSKLGKKTNRTKLWLSTPNPALDGRSPLNIYNQEGGELILKTLLMRMH